MTRDRRNWFEGWRLLAVLTLVLTALSVWIAGMRGFEVDGIRMVIRFTARSSLLFFCLAFAASALAMLLPASGTHWLQAQPPLSSSLSRRLTPFTPSPSSALP